MKKIYNTIKRSILFYTVIYLIIFIISKFIINLIGFDYMKKIYISSTIIIILGIIASIIQTLIKNKSMKKKIISTIIYLIIIVVLLIFYTFIFFVSSMLVPEYIIDKDNNKYVAYVYSWIDTRVEYYDYINFFIRGSKKKIQENYNNVGKDVLSAEVKKIYTPDNTYYYDYKGNIISKNSNINSNKVKNTQSNELINTSSNILYENKISNNVVIRVISVEDLLGQKSAIQIEKSINSGLTFEVQSRGTIIHNGAEIGFINENVGFINDFGLQGENTFLVTTDGGKTFKNSNIIHPDIIEEKNLLVKGVPYIENKILKLQVYTVNHAKSPSKTYYTFYSNDNGLNWSIQK